MKKWLIVLCIAMGILLAIGLWFIGVGLQREYTAQQLRRDMQKQQDTQMERVSFTQLGEAAHV